MWQLRLRKPQAVINNGVPYPELRALEPIPEFGQGRLVVMSELTWNMLVEKVGLEEMLKRMTVPEGEYGLVPEDVKDDLDWKLFSAGTTIYIGTDGVRVTRARSIQEAKDLLWSYLLVREGSYEAARAALPTDEQWAGARRRWTRASRLYDRWAPGRIRVIILDPKKAS
jgi:hypothetical protein